MSLKKCIVSFADKAGSYQKKLLRLEQSLRGNFDGDFLGFTSYSEIGSPTHSEIPYAFKPFAIQKAIDSGYELILWADSPIYAKQNIQPVFDYLEREGYLFFDNIGFSLGDYCNDKVLQHYQITRSEAFKIKQIMACCMGFKFNKPSATKDTGVLSRLEWFGHYKNISLYPGEWDNDDLTESKDRRVRGHRHDQSLMSAIIHVFKLGVLKGQDTFFAYESHRQVMPIADSVCLFSG